MAVSEAEPEMGSLTVDQESEMRWVARSLHQFEIFFLPFVSGHSSLFMNLQGPGNCCNEDDIEVEAGCCSLHSISRLGRKITVMV
jgi:hypothetical protein